MNATDQAEALLALLTRSRLAHAAEPLARVVATEIAFRAVQVLAHEHMMTVRGDYATTNQAMIFAPDPEVVPERDAAADDADTLRPIDVIDMLSDVDLPCIAPRLHRGWQDRVQSCREARRITEKATGFTLDARDRDELLAALAFCNRVLRVPPPVELPAAAAASWLPPVLRLIERLGGATVRAAVGELRKSPT